MAEAKRITEILADHIPGLHEGDAHSSLVSIYRDPRYPLEMRMTAASKAMRFEKPALSTTEVTGAGGAPLHPPPAPVINVQFVQQPEARPILRAAETTLQITAKE